MDFVATPDGLLHGDGRSWRCVFGRSGIRSDKREGDGATPVGIFPLRQVYYRPDRLTRPPQTALPIAPLSPTDGWCDDPRAADYNRLVSLPHPAHCEDMWRNDGLYDVLAVLGYNDDPPIPGAGSAIFLHVAKPDGAPTEGCVALALDDLLKVLAMAGPDCSLRIEAT
jgi:L,D-peptidoglycan transpeptidase YkuD (ErfK/YbiS/YcfS/YnhG family)